MRPPFGTDASRILYYDSLLPLAALTVHSIPLRRKYTNRGVARRARPTLLLKLKRLFYAGSRVLSVGLPVAIFRVEWNSVRLRLNRTCILL